jgi:aminomethyltransferase
VDDLLVYAVGSDRLLVVNAANFVKDLAWIRERAPRDVTVVDENEETAQLAVQGPRAEDVVTRLYGDRAKNLEFYAFFEDGSGEDRTLISRTGYTGEDGFEVYCRPEDAEGIFRGLLAAGQADGVQPCGLGARDTLRLEAKMALYGNDIDDTITPWEADLAWIVKMNKGEFIGREALAAQRQAGVARKLAGFEMVDRGIARHGYPAKTPAGAGVVTSGTHSPTLGKPIGLALLPASAGAVGSEFNVEIRGRDARARVIPTPFYKRPDARRDPS